LAPEQLAGAAGQLEELDTFVYVAAVGVAGILAGNRATLYGTLATLAGPLLGFIIATLTIFVVLGTNLVNDAYVDPDGFDGSERCCAS
jgi:hypothetical protein